MTAMRVIVTRLINPVVMWRQLGARNWGTGMFSGVSTWLRLAAIGATAIVAAGAFAAPAAADVMITVDKSTQQMSVMVDGYQRYTWAVSTGLHGGPPTGTFHPQRMERMWYSHAFGMAPMPHS